MRGEETFMNRMFHKASDLTEFYVALSVFFDAMHHHTVEGDVPHALTAWLSQNPVSPVVTCHIGQYRMTYAFWSTYQELPPHTGFERFSAGLSGVEESETLWVNHFLVTLSVNNSAWGHTSPVAGEYERKSGYEFDVTAVPEGGHSFDHWELDGVNVGSTNPYALYPSKPCELKAVFT